MEIEEYRPELAPIRGQKVAWTLTALAGLAIFLMVLFKIPLFWFIPALFILFLISASLISLGNWIDRHTVIRIFEDGIEFEDGLRSLRFKWEEINRLEVYSSSWGSRITVYSGTRRFSFRTLGVVKLNGQLKGRMGFLDGEMILAKIVKRTNLRLTSNPGNGYYYTRQ
jgi:hypothetical protein